MWKEIRSSFFGALITAVITMCITLGVNYFSSPNAKVLIAYSSIEDGNYINSILVKNINKDEYLNEFDIIVDSKINIYDVTVNNNKFSFENNTIRINSINPNDVVVLTLKTSKEIKKDYLTIAKNNQKFEIDYFNNYKNLSFYTIILVFVYAILNFLFSLRHDISNAKIKKENDEKNKEIKATLDKNEEIIQKIEKKADAFKSLYIKEMDGMERELQFYQKLLTKACNEKITKDELEKLISKELKTFSKKKFKHLNYGDVYRIILRTTEDN